MSILSQIIDKKMSAKATLNRLEPKIVVLGHADEEIQDKVEDMLTVLEDKVEGRLIVLEDKVEDRLTVLEDKVEWIHKHLIDGIKRINDLHKRVDSFMGKDLR